MVPCSLTGWTSLGQLEVWAYDKRLRRKGYLAIEEWAWGNEQICGTVEGYRWFWALTLVVCLVRSQCVKHEYSIPSPHFSCGFN
jgi:hypothetical protein